jgi:hypothetical protein
MAAPQRIFEIARLIASASPHRLQNQSNRRHWWSVMTAAKADILEEMLIGVAEVNLRRAARPEETLQECPWKAQAASGRRGARKGLLLCRDIGHGGYPSENRAGLAGL